MRATTNGITLGIVACFCISVAPALADMRAVRQFAAGLNGSEHFHIILVADSDRGNYLTDQKRAVEPREQRKVGPVQRSTSRPKPQQARTTQPAKARQSMKSIPGEYRTVCVRTCDGYYFPMSFSSSGVSSRAIFGIAKPCAPTPKCRFSFRKTTRK